MRERTPESRSRASAVRFGSLSTNGLSFLGPLQYPPQTIQMPRSLLRGNLRSNSSALSSVAASRIAFHRREDRSCVGFRRAKFDNQIWLFNGKLETSASPVMRRIQAESAWVLIEGGALPWKAHDQEGSGNGAHTLTC